MPTKFRVNYSLRAAAQLDEVFDYIARNSPQNAAQMIQRLLNATDRLEVFPHRYKVLDNTELFGENVHSMTVRPYLVRYQIDEATKTVTIVSVRHGARQPGL